MENLVQNKIGDIKFTDLIIRQTIFSIIKLIDNKNIKVKELKIDDFSDIDNRYVFKFYISKINHNRWVLLINSFICALSNKIEINLKIINPVIVVQLT